MNAVCVKTPNAWKKDKKNLLAGDRDNHVFGSWDIVSKDEETENLGKTVNFGYRTARKAQNTLLRSYISCKLLQIRHHKVHMTRNSC